MKTLIKLDRISAWILFVSLLLYFVTGYGMTKGIIDTNIATSLHNNYLNYIILFSFIFHTGFAIRLTLLRWKIWNRGGMVAWLGFFVIFLLWFIYVESFYSPISSEEDNSTETAQVKNVSIESSATQTSTSDTTTKTENEKTFTKEELAKYDGTNGNSAYVAVDGVVYDMTTVFKNGTHFSHIAGTELTNAFYSYHVKSSITKYPVVGKYSGQNN